MSDVEQAVFDVLANDSRITSLIGNGTAIRLYQQKLAQNTQLPAMTYRLFADPSVNSHSGSSGLARARIQFDCYAKTKEETMELSKAVRLVLVGIKRYSLGMLLQGAFKINEMTIFDPDVRLRRRMLDMAIWHSEEN